MYLDQPLDWLVVCLWLLVVGEVHRDFAVQDGLNGRSTDSGAGDNHQHIFQHPKESTGGNIMCVS